LPARKEGSSPAQDRILHGFLAVFAQL
jgi:hypothetical protein